MISVEQVHRLETRIERVLRMLAELRDENASLTTELQAANASLEESDRKVAESERARHATEEKLRQIRTNQAEIEEPLNRMLHQLDEFEGEQPEAPQDSPAEADAAEPEPEPAVAQAVTAEADETAAVSEADAAPAAEAEAATETDAATEADTATEANAATEAGAATEADAATEAEAGEQPPPNREGAELDIF